MIKKGKRYKCRPLFGGNWNNSANCGSRSSNWSDTPLNLSSAYSSRGIADTDAKHNSLADLLSLSVTAKYTTTGHPGLVGFRRSGVMFL